MEHVQCLLPKFEGGIAAATLYELVGFTVVSVVGLHILWLLFKRFIRPGTSLKRFGAGKGAWAIVTGASDGIGKQFAIDLGKAGFNMLLISRTQSKLDAVAQEIEEKNGKVEIRTLAVDFIDLGCFEKVGRAVKALDGDIGMLINNVGINYEYPKLYMDEDRSWDQSIIDVNVKGLNKMIDLVLPSMVEQGFGGIINLSSLTGMIPTPMLSTYSATKAYIKTLSECLSHEYRSKGIAVMAITPGLTVSNMSKIKKASATVSTPKIIVGRSLRNLGNYDVYCPDNMHAIVEYMMGFDFWRKYVLAQLLVMNKGIQKASLRRKERLAKQKQ